IREWHRLLVEHVGHYSANKAKQHLGTILALAAEAYNLRPPALPRKVGKGRVKEKKTVLSQAQISNLVSAARADKEKGIYYVFGFLVGTRPSEQLGLLWQDIDFERRIIRICRVQERDGSLTNYTKTVAGMREIPMTQMLYEMLLEWRI